MGKDLTVLILSAGYGDGHVQVSRALQKKFFDQGVQNVRITDLFHEAHPLFNAITRYLYIKSFTVAPSLYGWCYYRTQQMRHDTVLSKWFNSFGLGKLREIIKAAKPDIVINTFPMLVMPVFREITGTIIPTFTVITDFVLHQRWIHSEIDKYYVATEDLKKKMVEMGVPPERIQVSGIPLRDAFEKPLNTVSVQQKYALDPSKKTVLVMAGAYGVLQNLKEVCRTLLSHDHLQILLVCGKNDKLKQEMDNCFARDSNVHVFGFVENVHELMGIASCIVTKAGGITLSEALHCNLPTLLFQPAPGQEKENADYLAEKGAAIITHRSDELAEQIQQLLSDEQRLFAMREIIGSLRQPDASGTVVYDVLNECGRLEMLPT